MGFHGFSFGSLILILIIAVLLFGTKRLRNMGEDLGAALRGFRRGMQAEESAPPSSNSDPESPAVEKIAPPNSKEKNV